MVGWHHQLNDLEFEQTLGDGEGQGNLAWCSSQGHKESDKIQRLSNKISKRDARHRCYKNKILEFQLSKYLIRQVKYTQCHKQYNSVEALEQERL